MAAAGRRGCGGRKRHDRRRSKIDKLSLAFGGLKAVSDFSLELPHGGLYGLIGPNGAGKTTVFNLLTGVYQPDTGDDPPRRRAHRRQEAVADRARRAWRARSRTSGCSASCRCSTTCAPPPACARRAGCSARCCARRCYVAEERAITERSLELLDVLGIAHRADEQAKSLPYGDQRRLEIARALATEPKVLLLDEPVAGMNTQEKHEMRGLIQSLREQFGVAILLIEHDMGLVMDICEHITVLDHGVTIATGDAARDPGATRR